MDNFKRILEVLNDLIKINKDREESYAKISRELTPAEHNLRGVFERKAQESRNNVVQLQSKAHEIEQVISSFPEDDENNEGLSGRIYNMWKNVKDFFTDDDKPALLKSCLDGDEAIVKCYEDALNQAEIPTDIIELLREQKKTLDASNKDLVNILEIDRSGDFEETPR